MTWAEAHVCIPQEVLSEGYLRWQMTVDFNIITVLNSISVFSLVILLVYMWKEQRQKLFGAIKISTISMLLIFNTILTILKFHGNFEATEMVWVTDIGNLNAKTDTIKHNGSLAATFYDEVKENWPTVCYIEGLILQYSFLSTLLWLNVMSFDVWINFRRLKPNSDIMRRQRFGSTVKSGFAHPKYLKYAVYAWLVPLLNVAFTLIMDFLPSTITDGYILPEIGKQRCAIKDYMVRYPL